MFAIVANILVHRGQKAKAWPSSDLDKSIVAHLQVMSVNTSI